eukprot:1110832-Pelagomonas_calceolata.AAC.5
MFCLGMFQYKPALLLKGCTPGASSPGPPGAAHEGERGQKGCGGALRSQLRHEVCFSGMLGLGLESSIIISHR